MDDDQPQMTAISANSGKAPTESMVRASRWRWRASRGPSMAWSGIFAVVFGLLLLIHQLFPPARTISSLVFVAIGVAFLIKWVIDRGTGILYADAIITALAAPGLIQEATNTTYDGLGTLCLGLAFLFIAAIRGATGGGIGWQAWFGGLLTIIGIAEMIAFESGDLVVPVVLLLIGAVLILRGTVFSR